MHKVLCMCVDFTGPIIGIGGQRLHPVNLEELLKDYVF